MAAEVRAFERPLDGVDNEEDDDDDGRWPWRRSDGGGVRLLLRLLLYDEELRPGDRGERRFD